MHLAFAVSSKPESHFRHGLAVIFRSQWKVTHRKSAHGSQQLADGYGQEVARGQCAVASCSLGTGILPRRVYHNAVEQVLPDLCKAHMEASALQAHEIHLAFNNLWFSRNEEMHSVAQSH